MTKLPPRSHRMDNKIGTTLLVIALGSVHLETRKCLQTQQCSLHGRFNFQPVLSLLQAFFRTFLGSRFFEGHVDGGALKKSTIDGEPLFLVLAGLIALLEAGEEL